MDLTVVLKNYAEKISGQYTEYDAEHSIIIVPVSGNRFQTVLGTIKHNDLYNRKLISLESKVCSLRSDIDFRMLLEQASFFNYCRFVIRDNYLVVEAVGSLTGIGESAVIEMVQEVANIADQYEMKLTGSDIH